VKIQWKNAFVGGSFTSLLFTIGKTLLGIYIGSSSVSSTYGAAASLVVILLWVYYSSQILFFGAEFTKFYSLEHEKNITPGKYGELVENTRAMQLTTERSHLPKNPDTIAVIGVGILYSVQAIELFMRLKKKKKKKSR
jgi:membrane protein